MDGLLLDTERVAQQAFCDIAEALGQARDRMAAAFLDMIGHSHAQSRAMLASILPPGSDLDRFDQDWSARFGDLVADGVPLRPHAEDVTAALARAGHPMAIVTSSRAAAARWQLESAGILSHFAAIIGGDDVTANKPHPEPYLAGAAALGVAATDCVAFEDSDTGARSATAAGCRVVQVPDLRPAGAALPDLGQAVATDLRHAVELAGLAPVRHANRAAPGN